MDSFENDAAFAVRSYTLFLVVKPSKIIFLM